MKQLLHIVFFSLLLLLQVRESTAQRLGVQGGVGLTNYAFSNEITSFQNWVPGAHLGVSYLTQGYAAPVASVITLQMDNFFAVDQEIPLTGHWNSNFFWNEEDTVVATVNRKRSSIGLKMGYELLPQLTNKALIYTVFGGYYQRERLTYSFEEDVEDFDFYGSPFFDGEVRNINSFRLSVNFGAYHRIGSVAAFLEHSWNFGFGGEMPNGFFTRYRIWTAGVFIPFNNMEW